MHYNSNADLPSSVKKTVTDEAAQTLFRTAFNLRIAKGIDQVLSFAGAYSALERANWMTNDDGVYVKESPLAKAERGRFDNYAADAALAATRLSASVDRDIQLYGGISKVDEDKRQVFGWFSVIEKDGKPVADIHGDVIFSDELETAAYAFTADTGLGGVMHEQVGKAAPKGIGRLIESVVFTKEKQAAIGIDLGSVGWWGGFQVDDNETWEDVKKGKYRAFSIHGVGRRRAI